MRNEARVVDRQRLSERRDALVLGGQVRAGLGDRLELDEAAEPLDLVEVDPHPAPQEQAAALGHDALDAERRLQRGVRRRGVGHLGDAVPALALLGPRRPLVLDQVRPARLLLAQLQPAARDRVVRVSLGQHAFVVGPQLPTDRERTRRVRIDRLQLDVAARIAHGGGLCGTRARHSPYIGCRQRP